MFTIIWNLHSFHVVDKFPNDAKMNRDYFVTKILSPFEQTIFSRGRVAHQKLFVVHPHYSSIHTSQASTSWLKEYGMRRMIHASYLDDLARIDFYLFSIGKEKLERIRVGDEDQLFECLHEIFGDTNHDELNRGFRAWVQGFKN
jgi:hypothetical protein